MRPLIILLFALVTHAALSQDHDWWAKNVQWDNQSSWTTYIKFKPRYLGPNALPIPELSDGKVPSKSSLSIESQSHFMKGDHTYNTLLRGLYEVMPGRIALEIMWIPAEYAVVSHELKTERNVFWRFYNNRWASGDVFLQTYLQLLKPEGRTMGLMLRMGHRLPSSTMLGAARFTDAPGYYFDLSSAFKLPNRFNFLTMAGFYVWQTNSVNYYQNDAFLFGVGLARSFGAFKLEASFRGYLGYWGKGDDPLAAALMCNYTTGEWQWRLGVQQGFLDLRYTTVNVGLKRFLHLNASSK
ncbi:MAG: hypothetical protein KGP35_09090 [Bacteroidetes bacterium]|nr:hypothetical protein [Bacteroidota bacterium]